jgi:hypothetical protein
MKTLKLIALLALVFVAGTVAGVVGTRIMVRHLMREAILHPEQVQMIIERSLNRQLQLDNEQQVQLHQILLDAHGQLRDLRLQYRPQMVTIISNANHQITAILTLDQRQKFDELKKKEHPLFQAIQQSR